MDHLCEDVLPPLLYRLSQNQDLRVASRVVESLREGLYKMTDDKNIVGVTVTYALPL